MKTMSLVRGRNFKQLYAKQKQSVAEYCSTWRSYTLPSKAKAQHFLRLNFVGGVTSAGDLPEVHVPTRPLFLIQNRRVGFPSWMSRVRIPSPAFLWKLLGFDIVKRELFLARAVSGSLARISYVAKQSKPGTVIFTALIIRSSVRLRLFHFGLASGMHAGHCIFLCSCFHSVLSILGSEQVGSMPFLCHFVREYIMTITNHIRRIEDLAEQVIGFVDTREYEMAHSALDDIEIKLRLADEKRS